MTDILLINPPQLELKEPVAYIPLGLAYLGAMLKDKDVKVLNLANKETYQIPEARVYGITVTSATVQSSWELINEIRAKYSSPIILGGPHITASPDMPGDILVKGEAETIIRNLVENPEKYKGVIDAGIVRDLDSLPFPARYLFDKEEVVNLTGIHGCPEGVKATTVITSRGCPFRCAFCCKCHPMYTFPRLRSPNNVLDEIKEIKEDYGIEHVRFIDDVFTMDKKRAVKIAQGMRELGVTFICITRADLTNLELLKALKDGGCTQIDFGVETASPRLLEYLRKWETAEEMERAILNAKSVGLRVKVFLMYGIPLETEEDRRMTLEFLKKTKPDAFTLSYFRPLPGSDLEGSSSSYWFYPDSDPDYSKFKEEIRRIVEG